MKWKKYFQKNIRRILVNQFYRTNNPEEQKQWAEKYKASLQLYPVDVSKYKFPELLIPL